MLEQREPECELEKRARAEQHRNTGDEADAVAQYGAGKKRQQHPMAVCDDSHASVLSRSANAGSPYAQLNMNWRRKQRQAAA
jgi:hypothetical protein